jgi:hypothetical protein
VILRADITDCYKQGHMKQHKQRTRDTADQRKFSIDCKRFIDAGSRSILVEDES